MADDVNKNAHCAQTKVHSAACGRLRLVHEGPEDSMATPETINARGRARRAAQSELKRMLDGAAEITAPFRALSSALAPFVALKSSLDAALASPMDTDPTAYIDAIHDALDAFDEAAGVEDRPISNASDALKNALESARNASRKE